MRSDEWCPRPRVSSGWRVAVRPEDRQRQGCARSCRSVERRCSSKADTSSASTIGFLRVARRHLSPSPDLFPLNLADWSERERTCADVHHRVTLCPMGNLHSMARCRDEVRRLFHVGQDRTGNQPSLPTIFPDQPAPVVRIDRDGQRVMEAMRWGFPQPRSANTRTASPRCRTGSRSMPAGPCPHSRASGDH
jgi:hypothetical protein